MERLLKVNLRAISPKCPQADEEVFRIISNQKKQSKTASSHLLPINLAKIEKLDNAKCEYYVRAMLGNRNPPSHEYTWHEDQHSRCPQHLKLFWGMYLWGNCWIYRRFIYLYTYIKLPKKLATGRRATELEEMCTAVSPLLFGSVCGAHAHAGRLVVAVAGCWKLPECCPWKTDHLCWVPTTEYCTAVGSYRLSIYTAKIGERNRMRHGTQIHLQKIERHSMKQQHLSQNIYKQK